MREELRGIRSETVCGGRVCRFHFVSFCYGQRVAVNGANDFFLSL